MQWSMVALSYLRHHLWLANWFYCNEKVSVKNMLLIKTTIMKVRGFSCFFSLCILTIHFSSSFFQIQRQKHLISVRRLFDGSNQKIQMQTGAGKRYRMLNTFCCK